MNLDFLLSSVVWNTAFEAAPAGGDSPALGDDRIREVKSAVSERLIKEHKMDLSSGAAASDGWHRQGSAIDYYQASAPTTRPDGGTALDASDYGRKWYCTTTGLEAVYTASGWLDISALGAQAPTSVAITSGSGNWTAPAGISKVRVTCIGGGGGGGGAPVGQVGGGGGGGGAAIKTLTVTPGSSYAYVIGAGGTAGTNTGGIGGTGGSTTFTVGAVVVTGGGGGGGRSGATLTGWGGAAGVGSSGDINLEGHYGDDGVTSSSLVVTGKGGDSLYGRGGRGHIAFSGSASLEPTATLGGGGAGAGNVTGGGTASAGAAGAAGIIIIEY